MRIGCAKTFARFRVKEQLYKAWKLKKEELSAKKRRVRTLRPKAESSTPGDKPSASFSGVVVTHGAGPVVDRCGAGSAAVRQCGGSDC